MIHLFINFLNINIKSELTKFANKYFAYENKIGDTGA